MADFEKIKDFIIDPSIREARAHVEVKRAMNPCPIDFSQFQSTNPRSNGIDKEYGEGEDASNFNIARKKYDDDEEPQFTASFGSGKGQLPVEPGRYRLIWSRHCHGQTASRLQSTSWAWTKSFPKASSIRFARQVS